MTSSGPDQPDQPDQPDREPPARPPAGSGPPVDGADTPGAWPGAAGTPGATWAAPPVPADQVPPGLWERVRGDVLAGVLVLVGCALCGLAVGAVWQALAPHVPMELLDSRIYYIDPEGEQAIGQDGWFAVVAAVAGLVVAPVVFWRFRDRAGFGAAVGLGVGGLLGAWLAWRFGMYLGPDSVSAQAHRLHNGATFGEPLRLRAKGVLYLWPLVSLIVYLGLAAGFGTDRLGGGRSAGREEPAPAPHPHQPWAGRFSRGRSGR